MATDIEVDRLIGKVNRDHWVATLFGDLPQMPSREALPTANADRAYRLITIPGLPDEAWMCLRNASGTWGWRRVATGAGLGPSGLPWVNVADFSNNIQNAIDSIPGGGVVIAPAGTYTLSATINVPSRVTLAGVGRSTIFTYAASFAGPAFKTVHPTSAYDNMFGQAYDIVLRDFMLQDQASANTNLTPTGRTEIHQGIEVTAVDQALISNVYIRDLKGYGVKLNGLVRESRFYDLYIHNCGDSANTKAALEITQTAGEGDDVNINHFFNTRVLYPEYYGLRVWGSLNTGPRQTHFIGCQFEGGGDGSGGSLGTPRAYDIIHLERVMDMYFNDCTFSNPGAGKFNINAAGEDAGNPVQALYVDNCHIEGANSGGGVAVTFATNTFLDRIQFATAHAAEGDVNVAASAGTVWCGIGLNYSATPFVGTAGHRRGKLDNTDMTWDND